MIEFKGAKLILFLGDRLVILRRDNKPDIPWPNHLDLPGGEREPGESVADCVLRETFEEIGLTLSMDALIWSHQDDCDMIYAAHLSAEREADIVFGSEGQGWCLMSPQAYIDHPDNIPRFARTIRLYLTQ